MKSIFYTTYGFYKNCGKFYDYLRESSEVFAFLDLKSHHTEISEKTKLFIFKKGKLFYEKELFTAPKDPPVFLVPLYHIVYFLNIITALFIFRIKMKIKPDAFVTSFSIWALGGCVGRFFGLCKKVVLWSWDYYPIYKSNPYYYIQKVLEPFETLAIKLSDHSWYASQSNFDVRVKEGQIKDKKNPKHKVVHWGTGCNITAAAKVPYLRDNKLRLYFQGAVHYEKGLSLIVESMDALLALLDNKLELSVVGTDSPFKEEMKDLIEKNGHSKFVKFLGFMSDEEVETIAQNSDLGIATYVPEVGGEKNFSYYADPAKLRSYLSNGLPILITKVPEIYKDIKKYNAGIVLEEFSQKSLLLAVKKYIKDPERYKTGAFELAQKDKYDVYYDKHFKELW